MGATPHERSLAQVNGVKIVPWARPAKLIGEGGHVRAVEFETTRLDDGGALIGTGDQFTLGRRHAVHGDRPEARAGRLDGSAELLTVERGKIVVDAERQTSLPGVWAGGDVVHGRDLTVVAVEDGKVAARAINRRLAA